MSSNTLTQIRDYINTRIAVSEPDLVEWKESLEDIGNIPQTILDRSYHVTLGTITSSNNIDTHIEDSASVVITVFKRAYNQPVEARDTVLQTANCIRLDLINPINLQSYKSAKDGNIEDVQSVSITPSEIDESNDNIIKVELEVNVRLFFGIT